MKAEWIFFDVGSTLVDETKAYEHRIREAIAGTDITFEEFQEKRKYFAQQNLRGDIEAAAHFGVKFGKWHHEDEILYPETVEILEYLTSKGYKLGVIANQDLGTEDRLKEMGIAEYFGVVAASAELGIAKPDKRIFLKALEMAGCTAENAYMVGDRLDNDIYPAKKTGMKTVWVKQGFSAYQRAEEEMGSPDFTAESLLQLKDIF